AGEVIMRPGVMRIELQALTASRHSVVEAPDFQVSRGEIAFDCRRIWIITEGLYVEVQRFVELPLHTQAICNRAITDRCRGASRQRGAEAQLRLPVSEEHHRIPEREVCVEIGGMLLLHSAQKGPRVLLHLA